MKNYKAISQLNILNDFYNYLGNEKSTLLLNEIKYTLKLV